MKNFTDKSKNVGKTVLNVSPQGGALGREYNGRW